VEKLERYKYLYKTVPKVGQVWVADLDYPWLGDDSYGCFDCDCSSQDFQRAVFCYVIRCIWMGFSVFRGGWIRGVHSYFRSGNRITTYDT
jgi:hypothetical protein